MKNTRLSSLTSQTEDVYANRAPLIKSSIYTLNDADNTKTLDMDVGVAIVKVNRQSELYEGPYNVIIGREGELNEQYTIYNNSQEQVGVIYKGVVIYNISSGETLCLLYLEEDRWVNLNIGSITSNAQITTDFNTYKSVQTQITGSWREEGTKTIQSIVTIKPGQAFYGFDLYASPNVQAGLEGEICLLIDDYSYPSFGPWPFQSSLINNGNIFRQIMNVIIDQNSSHTINLQIKLTSGNQNEPSSILKITSYFQDQFSSFITNYDKIQTNMPIGTVIDWFGTPPTSELDDYHPPIPTGFILLNGTILPGIQNLYKDFYNFIIESGLVINKNTYDSLMSNPDLNVYKYAYDSATDTLYFPRAIPTTDNSGNYSYKAVCVSNRPTEIVATPQPLYKYLSDISGAGNENTSLKLATTFPLVGDGTVNNPLSIYENRTNNVIGTIVSVASSSAYIPIGCLPCDGAEYTKAQFIDLWNNYLNAATPLLNVCSYVDYISDISAYGQCGKFGIDVVGEKFKVPTIREGDNVRMRFFVVVANGSINQSQMDWSAWASGLANKLNTDGTNLSQSFKEMSVGWGMPDYSTVITGLSNPFTAPTDGLISWNNTGTQNCTINGNTFYIAGTDYNNEGNVTLLLSKNDVIFFIHDGGTPCFVSLKGVN